MNAFVDHKTLSKNDVPETVIDWTVDIDRIARLAREAFVTNTPDPWTRVEAECVVQLIDSELIALETRKRRGENVEAAVRRLKALRTEALQAIKTLDAVDRDATLEPGIPAGQRQPPLPTTSSGASAMWDGASDRPSEDRSSLAGQTLSSQMDRR